MGNPCFVFFRSPLLGFLSEKINKKIPPAFFGRSEPGRSQQGPIIRPLIVVAHECQP